MPNNILDYLTEYLSSHKDDYVGKYRFKCAYRTGENETKAIYYMIDASYRTYEIFVELKFDGEIKTTFSENLNEQESQYIINDLLERTIRRQKHKVLLHYSLYEKLVNEEDQPTDIYTLAPMDYMDVLGYIKYHKGINQKTIDRFYDIFRPAMARLREQKRYSEYLETIYLLFNNVSYAYEWGQGSSVYLDTEYQYHLFYLRYMIHAIYRNFDELYNAAPDMAIDFMKLICTKERFSMMIMVDYMKRVVERTPAQDALFEELNKEFKLFNPEEKNQDADLAYSYIYALYYDKRELYYEVVKEIIRHVMNGCLSYVNHDLDIALGYAFVDAEGYEILLDIFQEDYNTYVFTVFPIDSFPDTLRTPVRDQLAKAIMFFAGRMDNEKYYHSSLEQILNVNRLLLDHFREWYE